MTIKHIYLLFPMAFLLFGCGDSKNPEPRNTEAPVLVTVATVSADNQTPFVTASGTVEAANSASLSTRMMGFVNRIPVKVGDEVTKGELLISINNADLSAKRAQVNASITEAQAAFRNAEKDYTRFQNLYEENSASQKELDDVTAQFEMAKARLDAAKEMKNEVESQFAYANVRAPFSGVVTNVFIDEGDMANPGKPLVAVEGPGMFEVTAAVPESSINSIKNDMKVKVNITSIGKMYDATVTEVSASAKNTGGQYLVTVQLEKGDDLVKSGMYATVQFPVEKTESNTAAILIPKEAIVNNGQLTGVYTVSKSGTALLRWLRLGREYGDRVEVLSGLRADEQYILSANGKLYNGVPIRTND
ncbi:efflux RND transporter periplasmic adaptor subunit [Flavobacteriaceae bacterium TK19130]|nr:efflux RND transporter periplasmic adaptor subunit [Thermobacterium salinum]